MIFDTPLIEGRLVRRYKRFLADVELASGETITVHCPNPGSMLGMNEPGLPVWISDSGNPKRKLRHTLELVQVPGSLVVVNTNLANRIAREAMESGLVQGMGQQPSSILPEQRYGENSRIDFMVREEGKADLFVEVKSVTLSRQTGLAEFPDSVTSRGAKHLRELRQAVSDGNRAMMLFIVQRPDCESFSLASDIDPQYAEAFKEAMDGGVDVRCIRCAISNVAIVPECEIEIAGCGTH
ncbi:MAG: DNA/RNA nuclease SfsA [Nitratireductor sp.]|nr:DNA/RNA nuclease SfsA [Nitratireductor sp.]MCC0019720.1 DNA/RNA nuclease SfsA [Nitratireductor sp.]